MTDEQYPTLAVLPAITHVELVRVQPEDVLACTSDRRLTDEEFHDLRENLSELFPGIRVAVIDGGVTLAVVRREEVEA